jgi:hypothetical protein
MEDTADSFHNLLGLKKRRNYQNLPFAIRGAPPVENAESKLTG